MTREEKAALFLMNLDTDVSESVLTQLGPAIGGRMRATMERLREAPESQELMDLVLGEFDGLLQRTSIDYEVGTPPPAESKPEPKPENPEAAKVENEPPRETAQDLLLSSDAAMSSDPLAALRQLPAERLAQALQGEHLRTVCVILDYLDATQGGEVLKRLPPETRRQVSLQLGQKVTSGAAVLQRVARAVVEKSRALGEAPVEQSSKARFKKMADMLRLLDKPERMEVLAAFDENDPDLAASVREFLYQFDDLLIVEDRSLQKLLGEVDSKSLAVALKGASEAIRDKVLNNLSKRARETLAEEMEFLGSLPAVQIEQAQKALLDVLQRLDQAGELVMTQ